MTEPRPCRSVHDPSVPLHESGGGRPPCGVFCCWMGLNQHAYFLLHTSGPGTHSRQTAQKHCLRRSHQQMQRTHGGGAGARVQQKHYTLLHICLTLLSSRHTCAAAGSAVCAAQPPIGQLLQPAAPSAQPFWQRRPLRAKPQEAGLRTPACTLPSCRQGCSQAPPP